MKHVDPLEVAHVAVPGQSRVVHLVTEYERWCEVYAQAGDLEDDLGPEASEDQLKKIRLAEKQAVRRMEDSIDELIITPARTLHDFGMKARVVREFQSTRWYGSDLEEMKLGRGELLARAMMIELIEINDLPHIRLRDFSPTELLPSYREPAAVALAPKMRRVSPHPAEPIACLAAELGKHFAETLRVHNVIDGAKDTLAICSDLQQRFEAYQDAICFIEANSPLGALAQICIAAGGVDAIHEAVSGENNYASQWLRCVESCLWSIRSFIEKNFQVDAKTVGADYWMSESLYTRNKATDLEKKILAEEANPQL